MVRLNKTSEKLRKREMGNFIWDKVFQNGPNKICGRRGLKILLGPFWNTLSHNHGQVSKKTVFLLK